MSSTSSLLRRAALAVAAAFALGFVTASHATSVKSGERDFAGAFIVEHVSTFDVQTLTMYVDVVGNGCMTDASRAACDNNGTQISSLIDNTGSATYTLRTPGGSIALKLTMAPELGGGDPFHGIRFGGTFVVVANSGTGCYKGSAGSGVWSGSAEFSGPVVPGINPPGPGRWSFWGKISRVE